MDAFFLSSFASFILTMLLLLSTTRGDTAKIEFRIGDSLNLEADRPIFLFIVSAVAVIFLVLIVLLIVGRVHPREGAIYTWSDFLAGRQFISVVLGLLFGSLFAFWLRDLIWLQPDEKVGSKPIIEAVVLAFLLLLGAFSDILIAAAYRISQINIAGTQLTFTPSKDGERAQAGLGSVPQGGSQQGQKGSSQALGLIGSLATRIENDAFYVNNLFPARGGTPPVDSKVPKLFERLGKYATCLNAVSKVSGDEVFAEGQLRILVPILRELGTSRSVLPEARSDELAGQLETLFRQLDFHAQNAFLRSRLPGATPAQQEQRTPMNVGCGDSSKTTPQPEAFKAAPRSEIKGWLSESQQLPDKWFSERPYMALLLAGALWHLGEYQGAIGEIDSWLPSDDRPKKIHPWQEIRARIYVSILAEEWLRRPERPPPRLMEYHLDNVQRSIELMRPLLREVAEAIGEVEEDVEKDGFRNRVPAAGGQCSKLIELTERKMEAYALTTDDWEKLKSSPVDPNTLSASVGIELKSSINELKKDRRQALETQAVDLFLFWLGQHAVFAYRASQMPDYYEKYSADVMKYRNFALKRDVFCVRDVFSDFKSDIDQLYADMLETYAEVELANATRIEAIPDRDAVKRALERAQQAAILGRQVIKPLLTSDRKESDGSPTFAGRIEPKKSAEIEDSLKGVQQRAERRLKAL
jgi:hypothetical protein